MNNRPHKKEKAKKRGKGYFVKKAGFIVHFTVAIVHKEPPGLMFSFISEIIYLYNMIVKQNFLFLKNSKLVHRARLPSDKL